MLLVGEQNHFEKLAKPFCGMEVKYESRTIQFIFSMQMTVSLIWRFRWFCLSGHRRPSICGSSKVTPKSRGLTAKNPTFRFGTSP